MSDDSSPRHLEMDAEKRRFNSVMRTRVAEGAKACNRERRPFDNLVLSSPGAEPDAVLGPKRRKTAGTVESDHRRHNERDADTDDSPSPSW